jgi:hypothetical protein
MKAYLVSVTDAQLTVELASALLDEGVLPEDLSVILDESYSDRISGSTTTNGVQRIQCDLLADEEDENMNYAGSGNPEMEPASENSLNPHEALYESEIGGGISTSRPEDDVSGVEEMDDSESVSEEMMDPMGTLDFRDQGPETPSLEDVPGRTSRFSTATGIHGQEAGVGVGLLAALMPAVVQGVGLVMGDGPLASDLLAEEDKAIDEGVAPFLKAQGLEELDATKVEAVLASGGGIIEVSAASGQASGRQVLNVIESHNHSQYLVLNVD